MEMASEKNRQSKTVVDVELMIELIRDRPILWDFSSSMYLRTDRKPSLWNEVAESIGVSVSDAKKKWKNLRDRYVKERNKLEKSSGSGTAEMEKIVWPYFRLLHSFLDGVYSTSGMTGDDRLVLSVTDRPQNFTRPQMEEFFCQDCPKLENDLAEALAIIDNRDLQITSLKNQVKDLKNQLQKVRGQQEQTETNPACSTSKPGPITPNEAPEIPLKDPAEADIVEENRKKSVTGDEGRVDEKEVELSKSNNAAARAISVDYDSSDDDEGPGSDRLSESLEAITPQTVSIIDGEETLSRNAENYLNEQLSCPSSTFVTPRAVSAAKSGQHTASKKSALQWKARGRKSANPRKVSLKVDHPKNFKRKRSPKKPNKSLQEDEEEDTTSSGEADAFPCNICRKQEGDDGETVMIEPKKFITHLKAKHGDLELLPCGLCRRTFKHPRSLVRHRKSHFGERVEYRRNCDRAKFGEFYCIECRRHFATSCTFRSHMLIHKGVKPFSCEHCEQTFRQKGTMIRHMQAKHGAERHHKCPLCTAMFATYSDVKRHRRRFHDKEKPFECETCKLRFFEKHLLYAHRRARHLGVYKCQYCDKTLADAYQEKMHTRRVHFKEKPYPCHLCNRHFACRKNLKQHYKVHPEVTPEELKEVLSRHKTLKQLVEYEKKLKAAAGDDQSMIDRSLDESSIVGDRRSSIATISTEVASEVSGERNRQEREMSPRIENNSTTVEATAAISADNSQRIETAVAQYNNRLVCTLPVIAHTPTPSQSQSVSVVMQNQVFQPPITLPNFQIPSDAYQPQYAYNMPQLMNW